MQNRWQSRTGDMTIKGLVRIEAGRKGPQRGLLLVRERIVGVVVKANMTVLPYCTVVPKPGPK